MKKVISQILLFCCFALSAAAQYEYVANNTDLRESTATSSAISVSASNIYFRFMAMDQSCYIDKINTIDAGKHFMGDYMAKKQYLLKKMYSYKEPIAPGSSATKTIYRKPDIYFSVKRIEKYLREELKNETLTAEVAKKDFNKVLDVALNILEENTESLERRINSVNGNAANLLRIYVQEIELNY